MRKIVLAFFLALFLLNCSGYRIPPKSKDFDSLPISIRVVDILKPFNRTTIVCFIPKASADSKILLQSEIDSVRINCPNIVLDCQRILPSTQDGLDFPIPVCYFESVNQAKEINNCREVEFKFAGVLYRQPFAFDTLAGNFISFPSLTISGDSLLVCAIDLIRIHPSEKEYFPTSERLRVEIINAMGKTVWRSDEGLYFLQVTGEVKPKELGKIHRYLLRIPKEVLSRFEIRKRKYTFRLSLPIKPKPIIHNLEYSGEI